jgi:hypothetical protein
MILELELLTILGFVASLKRVIFNNKFNDAKKIYNLTIYLRKGDVVLVTQIIILPNCEKKKKKKKLSLLLF